WLGKRGDHLGRERLAGVLDRELHTVGACAGRDPDGALVRQVVDDRIVNEVRAQLQQEGARADGGRHLDGGLDRDAALFCEGEERFGGFFGHEGQVDVLSGEERWPARLSRSNASVRSISRVLMAWRRSTSSPWS